MSNIEDITSVLADNGNYDPDRAEQLRKDMVDNFTATLRKVERWYWGFMCLSSWLFMFVIFQFLQSSSTKALLFYGILALVFFQAMVLMKLWYWIANQKIGILKAIKQLELRGMPGTTDISLPDGLRAPVEGLPRRERMIWRALLLTGCAVIGAVKVQLGGVDVPWALDTSASAKIANSIATAPCGCWSTTTEMPYVSRGTLAQARRRT